MLSYSRRGLWRLFASAWAMRSSQSFAQTKLPGNELKIRVQLDNMSDAVRDSLKRRLNDLLVAGRYVRSVDGISNTNQSGPSTDPDYGEFWVEVVKKGEKSSMLAGAGWSERSVYRDQAAMGRDGSQVY